MWWGSITASACKNLSANPCDKCPQYVSAYIPARRFYVPSAFRVTSNNITLYNVYTFTGKNLPLAVVL